MEPEAKVELEPTKAATEKAPKPPKVKPAVDEPQPEKSAEVQRVEGVIATMKGLTPHYKRSQLTQLLRDIRDPQSPEYRLILETAKSWKIDLSQ